ncbi:sugar O-acyltransferase (sialic acid O-acetyltransferase NeuD family) [Anoxybacillus tepidamans]|uniref:Sugar O-acyltransferase (Sialic acid O-acetyltransferase NeuD family) n=1 Tax=Anoxybacteroides tepidamans TaxID=265948 RepID=A0A7W8IPC8_9BACL|nr:acetyltransferase [Anoxybacillus tepidamans]MBB5324276.1 sugar O-acyltransferase (sialic acid O-acetyltransferase NeuD family) [Anoxybacillus tepidamans]
MKKIVVFGSGGHAKVVIDIVGKSEKYSLYGVIDGFRSRNEEFCGYKILGDESSLLNLNEEIYGGIVAIGDNWVRRKVVEKVIYIIPNFKFISLIHPSAVIGDRVKIGDGTVVMGGVVINSDTVIGEHCIINTKSSIDHDCLIGNYVSIAPGVTLAGNVKIGDYSAISLGANVIHSINIGEHTLIGAGATVIKDIESYVVAYGTPAKIIRSRKIGEKYL